MQQGMWHLWKLCLIELAVGHVSCLTYFCAVKQNGKQMIIIPATEKVCDEVGRGGGGEGGGSSSLKNKGRQLKEANIPSDNQKNLLRVWYMVSRGGMGRGVRGKKKKEETERKKESDQSSKPTRTRLYETG